MSAVGKCSLLARQRAATVSLKAQPPHGAERGIWWFCDEHAIEAEAKGYAPLDGVRASHQLELEGAAK